MRVHAIPLVLVLVIAACADGTTAPDPAHPPKTPVPVTPDLTGATLIKAAGDSQTALVKSAVAVSPAVVVVSKNGSGIPGVAVQFAVVDGGGSISSSLVTTDSLGLATLSLWELGSKVGVNRLQATLGTAVPVIFTATGVEGPPAAMRVEVAAPPTATVGEPIPVRPAVRVIDIWDNPIQGIAVTFALTAGDGNATGTTATTDALGIATVGGWTLGTVAGPNELTASAPGLRPVVFAVSATAGAPAGLVMVSGDGQVGYPGDTLEILPAVRVEDAYGNPVNRALVWFRLTSGGGAFGNCPGCVGWTQLTDFSGVATAPAWVLGPSSATNTLVASVANTSVWPPVTFTALARPCDSPEQPHVIGTTVAGSLSETACRTGYSEYTDRYAVKTTATVKVRFSMSSSVFDSRVSAFSASGAMIGTTSYYCCGETAPPLELLLPLGDYVVGASGFANVWDDYYGDDSYIIGRVTGPYTLTSAVVDENVTGCEGVFVVPGLTASQRVEATDCQGTFRAEAYYYDQFLINVVAGETYTFAMTSADFDTYLDLSMGSAVASNDDFGGSTNSLLTFTPSQSGTVVIRAGTYKGNTTGAYTLSINATGASARRSIGSERPVRAGTIAPGKVLLRPLKSTTPLHPPIR